MEPVVEEPPVKKPPKAQPKRHPLEAHQFQLSANAIDLDSILGDLDSTSAASPGRTRRDRKRKRSGTGSEPDARGQRDTTAAEEEWNGRVVGPSPSLCRVLPRGRSAARRPAVVGLLGEELLRDDLAGAVRAADEQFRQRRRDGPRSRQSLRRFCRPARSYSPAAPHIHPHARSSATGARTICDPRSGHAAVIQCLVTDRRRLGGSRRVVRSRPPSPAGPARDRRRRRRRFHSGARARSRSRPTRRARRSRLVARPRHDVANRRQRSAGCGAGVRRRRCPSAR